MKDKKMADKAGRAMTKKSPDTMGRAMKKYAEGGSVSSRADGIAKKGKTDTKMPKMAMGGNVPRNVPSSGAIGRNLGGDPSKINMNPTQTGSGSTGQLMGRAGAIGSKLSSMGRAGAMTRPRGGIQRKKGGSC
jgi:ribosomal protein L21E